MEIICTTVRELPPVWEIGSKLYFIRNKEETCFEEPCPMCDDKKKITYRGFTVDCPLCNGRSFRSTDVKRVRITLFELGECIINGYGVQGPEVKSAYKGDGKFEHRNLPRVCAVTAFSRHNAGWNSIMSISNPLSNDRFDPIEERIRTSLKPSDYFFTTKKNAEIALKILAEKEHEKLEKFNKEHGTDHKWPWNE